MSAFIKNLTASHLVIYIVVILMIIIEIGARITKQRLRGKFKKEKITLEELGDIERVSITYYKQYQWVDIVRFFSLLCGIIITLIAFDVQAFNILAVVAGTFIIVLREFIFSFVAFFYLISAYHTGDDVQIENIIGEIFRITPLYVALSGKDEDGEYNGKLYRVPNFTFISKTVELQKLKTDDYRKIVLHTVYANDHFPFSFSQWLDRVRAFLDEKLPQRHLGKVGNYKDYTGAKYKINFDYKDDGKILIKISFVAKYPTNIRIKEEIIEFIESLKMNPGSGKKKNKSVV